MKQFNERLYRLEQKFVAICIAVMGAVVFLDVVHRVASRERGLMFKLMGDAPAAPLIGLGLGLLAALLLVFAALRTRGQPPGSSTWVRAATITVGLYTALRAFIWLVPNGLVWSQTLGLVLMLWVGCIGASMATHEHRHLALDLGSKLWPRKVLPYAQAGGNLVTSLFCAIMVALSIVSLRSHYGDYVDTEGAGGTFVALPIPKWVAFLAVPTGFTLMCARFFAQFVISLRGHVEEDDPLQMLGIKDESKEPS